MLNSLHSHLSGAAHELQRRHGVRFEMHIALRLKRYASRTQIARVIKNASRTSERPGNGSLTVPNPDYSNGFVSRRDGGQRIYVRIVANEASLTTEPYRTFR